MAVDNERIVETGSVKPNLEFEKPGLEFEFNYTVPENKTVPHMYPEIPESQIMPRVFAMGSA